MTAAAAGSVAAARHDPPPDGGYEGEYVAEIAQLVLERHPEVLGQPGEQALETFGAAGVALMLAEIRESLAGFGVRFDVYFNESDLRVRGELDAALERLAASGHVYAADGATWVRTTDFGDDKDRVYVRGNGEFTYFAADCAYYLDKRRRGFGQVIILGADHHGYVGRMRAVAACFGEQYAHARVASLLRNAAEAGIGRGARYDPALLTHDRENDLLKAIAEFPGVVAAAAGLRQPHRARYLEELAGTYHRFYDACRILPRDGAPPDETGRARLWLAEAAGIVLANGLGLLGVGAPGRL